MPGTEFFAHSANDNEYWEPLKEHIEAVAWKAAEFAKDFGAEEEARLAGLLHDLGKYTELFQRRLRGQESGLDHWSIGAWDALLRYKSVAAAVAIQGHHIGLCAGNKAALQRLCPEWQSRFRSDGLRSTGDDLNMLTSLLGEDGFDVAPPASTICSNPLQETVSSMLDIRMLFSALVDADYLATEAHFEAGPGEKKRYRVPGILLQPEQALSLLMKYIAIRSQSLSSLGVVDNGLLAIRKELLDACLEKAELPPGLFTLSAPTGTGKTLAMLAFALAHARSHREQFRRIIVVIPFLSIIEQTVKVYREVFAIEYGEEFILEHHSLAGIHRDSDVIESSDRDAARIRQLSENWDAPLIVTTSVQLLESLFSNRPAACRKLHNLARSIILFDEVQTLPISLAVPTLKALAHLTERFCSTVVFATATQPAFTVLEEKVRESGVSGWRPTEIVSDTVDMFQKSRRTKVIAPDLEIPKSWKHLATELVGYRQILCVVNLKRHALELLEHLNVAGVTNLYHLSTNLCAAHRIDVLEQVRTLLVSGQPCCLVATQCIEAGVDVDFPVVYRALGPLDAIAQAAGRCNRNANLKEGEVKIFLPESDGKPLYPPGVYEQATSTLVSLLREQGERILNIHDPVVFSTYFRKLYALTRPELHKPELKKAIEQQDFEKVAREYRLIPKEAINVLVSYEANIFRSLVDEARSKGLSSKWMKAARPYLVSLFRPTTTSSATVWNHLENIPLPNRGESPDWFICRSEKHYDRVLRGLSLPESIEVMIA